MMPSLVLVLLAAGLIVSSSELAAQDGRATGAAPAVVVSIKPVHSLVAGVMAGIGTPQLLIEGAGSPHSYALRPSQAQALQEADVVFWIGEGLEAFLAKPLAALAGNAEIVALADAEGMRLLPTREGGMWEEDAEHEADADHAAEHDEPGHGTVDMHVWLDPRNAEVLTAAIAAALSEADSERAATYRANAAKVVADLARLDEELATDLAPVQDRPFVVFHDGYQYFESRYGLRAVGSIAVDPQRRPGAGRLRELQARLEQLGAACVFAEPQFRPALVDTLVEGTDAGVGVLDLLGAEQQAGPDQYFQLLRALSRSLVDCLGTPRSG